MKNEVMAQAMTYIDDELITQAGNAKPAKKSFRPVYSLIAVAACIVLVFTFIFAFPKNYTQSNLLINGEIITDSPFKIDLPVTAQARDLSQSISLFLTLQISEDTKIKVSHGKMDICSSDNTDTLYFSGTEYTTDKPVNINWYLDDTDINSVYTLTLSDSTVYNLSFDTDSSLWTICKQ